jgi:2-polyprenyl-3-methyl-5-hydroxy-6-metoxy-1,4-benzoquinol methylase
MSAARPMPSSHFQSLRDTEGEYWWHRFRLRRAESLIREYAARPETLRYLDYGCGTGGFLHHLNAAMGFAAALGVDVSEEALCHAARYPDRYRLVQPGDFSPAGEADIITLMDVLEHIDDHEAFLGGMADAMRPGTMLLVSVPAMQCLYSAWDETLGHCRRYSPIELEELASRQGLRKLSLQYAFSYLAPAIVLKRMFSRTTFNSDRCEFPPTGAAVRAALSALEWLERRLIPPRLVPFGSSVFGLFVKTGPKA